MSACTVRAADRGDRDAWVALRAALWPDAEPRAHAVELEALLRAADRAAAFLAFAADGTALGFAEASVRVDYVNGTDGPPVGFLEGLYVAPAARRHGVGRALVAAVERWTHERGCRELASDARLDNAAGHAAHRAYGFEETERVVYFRKRLGA